MRNKEYELENGLVVALRETVAKTISAKLRVNYSTFHEKPGEEGLAHLLEHGLISGGTAKHSPKEADNIRSGFGGFNAFTSVGRISFVGEMLNQDIIAWLDLVSEQVFNPRLDEKRINGEKERVLREISDYKSNVTYSANKEFDDALYGGHPKQIEPIGKESSIKSADVDKLRAFHKRGFHANNMDLILAGGFPSNIEKIIQEYFGGREKGPNTRVEFPEIAPLEGTYVIERYAPEKINQSNPEESSVVLSLSSIVPSPKEEDSYAFRIASHILGGNGDSLLFQGMGLEKGLAYSSSTSYNGLYNVGTWNILSNIPSNKREESLEVIFNQMKILKDSRVPEKILERVKKISRYSSVCNLETNNGQISSAEMKLDSSMTEEDLVEGYARVTADDILRVTNKYFPDREEGPYVMYVETVSKP